MIIIFLWVGGRRGLDKTMGFLDGFLEVLFFFLVGWTFGVDRLALLLRQNFGNGEGWELWSNRCGDVVMKKWRMATPVGVEQKLVIYV